MNGGTLSGGVVIALAATLWLAYLLPTWLRRRDYLNAERNAVRLQQTLRILAETAETPEEVRVEATAREVARQQKILKKVRAKADAAARAHLASEARAAARLAAEAEALESDCASSSPVSAARESDHAAGNASSAARAGRRGNRAAPPRSAPARSASIGAVSSRTTRVASSGSASTRAASSRIVSTRAASSRTASARTASTRAASSRTASTRVERERAFTHAVRRTRLATTGTAAASFVGIGFGAYSFLTDGSWGVLAASVALLVCAVAVLRRLGQQVVAHATARRERMQVVRQNPDLYDHALYAETDAAPEELDERDTSWAPRPLPKPMYQSPGSRAATAMASLDAAVALRRAAAKTELEQRAARLAAAQVPTITRKDVQVEQPAAAAREGGQASTRSASDASANGRQTASESRYARMGMIDGVQSERIDLDEALRRRRIAG